MDRGVCLGLQGVEGIPILAPIMSRPEMDEFCLLTLLWLPCGEAGACVS